MKLRSADPAGLADLRRLRPAVAEVFATATAVVTAFAAAFPLEPEDEYLDSFLIDELARGGFALARR